MAFSALLVGIIGLFYLQVATASNITHCYVCASPGQPECEDEFDITLGNSIQCNSINYGRALEPQLATEYPLEDIERSERISNTTTFQYYCVKLGVQYKNNTNGIIRSCHQHVDSVGDVCEFIRAEQSVGLARYNVSNVVNCNACNDVNNCNSAGSICASVVMIFITMLLTKSY